MGTITIPGFPTNMMVPGIYMNVQLGMAPPSAAGKARKVLLIGTNNTGEALPGVLYRVSRITSRASEGEVDMKSAEDLFGVSETHIVEGTSEITNVPSVDDTKLYWMTKAAFTADPFVSVYTIKTDGANNSIGSILDTASAHSSGVSAQCFDYIVVDDNGERQTLIDFVEMQASPTIGIRQQGILGSSDDTVTVDTPNSARLQLVWAPQTTPETDVDLKKLQFKNGEHYTGEMLAAAVAATRAKHEANDPASNLCYEKVTGVPAIPDNKKSTKTTLNNCLLDGVTPLVSGASGMTILRSVTTAANPAVNDTPVFDTNKVTVSDFVANDIEMKMMVRYNGFKLAPDTDVPPPSRTATPSTVKASLMEWLRSYQAAGMIVLVDEKVDQVRVEIDDQVDGRINFEIPEDVIEIFAVGAGNILQIG